MAKTLRYQVKASDSDAFCFLGATQFTVHISKTSMLLLFFGAPWDVMTNVIWRCNLTHCFQSTAASIITLEKDWEVKNNDSRN